MNRAYSLLTIKAVEEDQRIIRGIATSPEVDRVGDIVEGIKSESDVPLFLYHDKTKTVGRAKFFPPTSEGTPFEAWLPKIAEPGTLKDRVDEAWQMVKYKLITGVSIGFREVAGKVEQLKNGGLRYLEATVLELSLVPIPAHQKAKISIVKEIIDRVAVSGRVVHLSPGVTGTKTETPKGLNVKTIVEQMSEFDTKRKSAAARLNDIIKDAEGRTLNEAEEEEYDGLESDIKSIDRHLDRLKAHEATQVAEATPVTQNTGRSVDIGSGRGPISVRRNLAPATAFIRFATSVAVAKGNIMQAERIAEQHYKDTPEVALCLKAAVAAGTTSATTWAAPLVQYNDMAAEFIELLRPMTIIGKLTALRRVPFNIRIPRQTAGVTGSFVGEGAPKPVNALAFDNITMPWAKAAVIVVLTDELVRFSNPSAEALVRQDMLAGIAEYLDKRFIEPQYAGVPTVSPASITFGLTPINGSATTVAGITAYIKAAMTTYANANQNLSAAVWIMAPKTALALSMLRNVNDEFVFPGINVSGGTFFGLPVVVSNTAAASGSPSEGMIVLVDQSEILLADDGQISIDASQEASVQMNDAPSAGAQSLVSLWQNNLLGLRAERYIYWAKRRSTAVVLIDNVAL